MYGQRYVTNTRVLAKALGMEHKQIMRVIREQRVVCEGLSSWEFKKVHCRRSEYLSKSSVSRAQYDLTEFGYKVLKNMLRKDACKWQKLINIAEENAEIQRLTG